MMTDTEQPVPVQNASGDAFPGLKTELQRALDLLKAKILTFVLIGLIGLVTMALANGAWFLLCLFLTPRVPPILLLLLPVLALPLIILPQVWMLTASLFALKESVHTVMEAIKPALSKLLGMLWLWLLMVVMVNGGFLLLIVPGVMLSVWFFFAWYVFTEENCHGVNALVQSREYVRGRFFLVLLRLLAVGILCAIVTAVGVIAIPWVGPYLVMLIGLFTGLFFFIYGYILYQDLRIRPGTIRADTLSRNDKLKTLAPGLAGAAALLIVIACTLPQKIPAMQDMMKMIQLTGKGGGKAPGAELSPLVARRSKGISDKEKEKNKGPRTKVSAEAAKSSTPPPTVDELYSGNLRNPFIALGGGSGGIQIRTASSESLPFSIHDLELTGIMKDSKGKQALLKNLNTGASYMLVRGRLLDSKRKRVPGVSGVIHRKPEVVLMTEDGEVQPLSLHKKEK